MTLEEATEAGLLVKALEDLSEDRRSTDEVPGDRIGFDDDLYLAAGAVHRDDRVRPVLCARPAGRTGRHRARGAEAVTCASYTDAIWILYACVGFAAIMTPLFGPKGIVAAHIVLFVSVDDGHAMPVTCSFALHPELMAETLPVAVGLLESASERGHDEAFAIAVPVKQ